MSKYLVIIFASLFLHACGAPSQQGDGVVGKFEKYPNSQLSEGVYWHLSIDSGSNTVYKIIESETEIYFELTEAELEVSFELNDTSIQKANCMLLQKDGKFYKAESGHIIGKQNKRGELYLDLNLSFLSKNTRTGVSRSAYQTSGNFSRK